MQVLDVVTAFLQMQFRHRQRGFTHIDAGRPGAKCGHALCQYAATTTDVEHGAAIELCTFIDPLKTQRIDIVQGFELALGVPPA